MSELKKSIIILSVILAIACVFSLTALSHQIGIDSMFYEVKVGQVNGLSKTIERNCR